MKFSLETTTDANTIHSYGDDFIVVKTKESIDVKRLDSSLIMTPIQIIADWVVSKGSPMDLYKSFWDKNEELGYGHQD